MSVISTDWRSLSHGGAEAAIRASIAGPAGGANRASFAGSVASRPQSTFLADGSDPQMAQIRQTGVGPRGGPAGGAERSSRISFAPDTRFSRVSMAVDNAGAARPRANGGRAGIPSRAFHSGYIPPVPTRESKYVSELSQDMQRGDIGLDERAISPRQQEGPVALSAEDIQEQIHGLHYSLSEATGTGARPSLDSAVIPALSMMRTNNDSQSDGYLPAYAVPLALYHNVYDLEQARHAC